MKNDITSEEFDEWFLEFTGHVNDYLYKELDAVFGVDGRYYSDTKMGIINFGLKGQDVIEFIEFNRKL